MATNFVFHNPTRIYFGDKQLEKLADEFRKYQVKTILLVYGGGSIKRNGIYDQIMKICSDAGVKVMECGGVEPNPRHTTVNKAAQICKDNNVDAVVAAGGGSTIDSAKAIAEAALYDGDCWDLVTEKASVEKALPIFTIGTLSAAGSENDAWTVITNLDTKEKVSPWKEHYQVKAAFVNPAFTKTVNAYQTAAGSMDILSHVTDCRYFISEKKLDVVNELMETMAASVIKYAPIAIAEPDNLDARENLAWVQTMITGGIMDLGSETSMVLHMMEHEISAYYDINHGHGIGILMPRWMEYVLDENTAPAFYRYGRRCLGVEEGLSDMEGAKKTIEAQKDWIFHKLGLASKLSDLGVDDKNIDAMAQAACDSVGGVLKGIKDLKKEDVAEIYRMSL